MASGLVLHCLPMSHKKDAMLIWVNKGASRANNSGERFSATMSLRHELCMRTLLCACLNCFILVVSLKLKHIGMILDIIHDAIRIFSHLFR